MSWRQLSSDDRRAWCARARLCNSVRKHYPQQRQQPRDPPAPRAVRGTGCRSFRGPFGLGSLDMEILPEQFAELETELGLSLNSAADHSKATNPQVVATPEMEKEFNQMDNTFRMRKPCNELGLCRGKHAKGWPEIMMMHALLQCAIFKLFDKCSLKSGDCLLVLQGIAGANAAGAGGRIIFAFRVLGLQWFKADLLTLLSYVICSMCFLGI